MKRFFLLAVGFLLLPLFECSALFYCPEAGLRIVSEYAAVDDALTPDTRVWKVVPEATADKGVKLQFFLEQAAGAEAVCTLFLPAAGAAGEIRWQGMGKNREKTSATGLLLVTGFPAPCDVLPVKENHEGRVYQEKTGAGGSVFVRNYKVSSEACSAAEAEAKGWIKKEASDASNLMMFTVTDAEDRLVVRQLWPENGSWWLYEETPLRRSWHIH